VKKKEAEIFSRLQGMRGLSEDERIQLARSLAASPQERWRRHENFLRSLGLFSRSERRRFGFS
jgi:hypothetical protein